jgi:hypothetical protein
MTNTHDGFSKWEINKCVISWEHEGDKASSEKRGDKRIILKVILESRLWREFRCIAMFCCAHKTNRLWHATGRKVRPCADLKGLKSVIKCSAIQSSVWVVRSGLCCRGRDSSASWRGSCALHFLRLGLSPTSSQDTSRHLWAQRLF